MKSFLLKIVAFLIPIILMVPLYIILDPFKVIYEYKCYLIEGEKYRVPLNMDYVSTKIFLRNFESLEYNSFIFGNSRSRVYHVDSWLKYLPSNASCFHYDASSESLYALSKKIEFVDNHSRIENVLMIADYSLLSKKSNADGHLFEISPQIDSSQSIVKFHYTFFKAFLQSRFFISYITLLFTHKMYSFMYDYIYDNAIIQYDCFTNEVVCDSRDVEMEKGIYYTPDRVKVFTNRNYVDSIHDVCLDSVQICQLVHIKKIFKKNNTNYKIIISPLYNQINLNPIDICTLKTIFGEENVFDFSGKNNITEDYHNYYERSHYIHKVADYIMKYVYEN